MKISFVWQGSSQPEIFDRWDDGLRRAMLHIEEKHEVVYNEPWDDIDADFILYWEAPCTVNGANAQHYNKIRNCHIPKALLFAGGPIQPMWVQGFDLIFTESQINDDEFERLGIPYIRAFGVNEKVFRPLKRPKRWDGMMQATFAGWKRHELFAEALGENGLAVGRIQPNDRNGYNKCKKLGVEIKDQVSYEEVVELINSAHSVVNTAEFWGGGQRCTLEAMACNIPVIVMEDSPKNCEYVRESGVGIIVKPEPEAIRNAIRATKEWKDKHRAKARKYIMSKWSSKHYAESLLKGIEQVYGKEEKTS